MRIPDRTLTLHTPLVAGCLIISSLLDHAFARLEILWPSARLQVPLNIMRLVFILATGYALFILARFSTRFTEATNGAMENFVTENPATGQSPK